MDIHIRHKLSHTVTEYDRKQSRKRGYNIYAISHYLGAVQEIETDIDNGADLRAAIIAHFNGRLCDVVLKACGLPLMTKDEARGW